MSELTLLSAAAALAKLYPPEKALTDPFEIVIWENIAYLADDATRAKAFEELRKKVGLTPRALLKAPLAALEKICAKAGPHAGLRVGRLHFAAELAMKECGGDVLGALKSLDLKKARALIKKFPGVGDPGADRMLLNSGLSPEPALDSNGLRVLTRLGFCEEEKSYAATYRQACKAILGQGKITRSWLMRLDQSARDHGRTLCRRTAPNCMACPLEPGCAYAQAKTG